MQGDLSRVLLVDPLDPLSTRPGQSVRRDAAIALSGVFEGIQKNRPQNRAMGHDKM